MSRHRKLQLSRSKALLVAAGALLAATAASVTTAASVATGASVAAATRPSGPVATSAQPDGTRAPAGGGRQAILSARETSDVLRLTIPVAPPQLAAKAAASRAAVFNSEMAAGQTPAATASPAPAAAASPTATASPIRTTAASAIRTAAGSTVGTSTASPTATPQPTPTPTGPASGSPQQIAQAMLGSFGWSASQFSCLNPLWAHESGWSVTASNASSGAYGIPQAVPGSKMASAGPDWQTNATTQIKWGLQYIKGTYGSPCAAYSHEQSTGWY